MTYFFVFNESILSWIWPLVKLLRILEQNFCAGFVSPVVMLDVHREHLKVGESVAYVLKIKINTYKKVWVVRLFYTTYFCLDTQNPETSEFRTIKCIDVKCPDHSESKARHSGQVYSLFVHFEFSWIHFWNHSILNHFATSHSFTHFTFKCSYRLDSRYVHSSAVTDRIHTEFFAPEYQTFWSIKSQINRYPTPNSGYNFFLIHTFYYKFFCNIFLASSF